MKKVGLDQRINYFFRIFMISAYLVSGLSTSYGARLPTEVPATPDEVMPVDYDTDWFLWLKEGNTSTFVQELKKIVQCVEDEKVDVKRILTTTG